MNRSVVVQAAGAEPPSVTGIAAHDLGILQLSDSSWRICDNRLPNDNARRLLGFIESKGDRFEVTQLDHGFVWYSFDSLSEAVAHFTGERPGGVAREDHVLSWTLP